MKGEYTFYNDTFEFDECLLHNINKTLNTCSKHIQKIYFLFTSFYLSWKGGRGQCIYFRSFTHIIEFLMNIWWQLILIRSQIIIWSYLCDQNWWNIIKKKLIRVFISVHWSASSKYGSTFICWRHTWRDLAYEYAWAKVPMISGYVELSIFMGPRSNPNESAFQ
jgi:hypothetical protein